MREFQLFREEDLEPVPPADEAKTEEAEAILDGLNSAQREAAATTEGPLMIIAGAGSGKTRTLTYRIAYLLATGKAKPWEILALTFTNKAAREMKERISHLIGAEDTRGLWMGTFHSMFARILRREAEKLGLTSDFSIYDTQDSERVVSGLMQNYNIDKKQFTPRSLISRISGAKNQLVGPDEYRRLAASPHDEKAALVYGPYVNILHKSNALDFDDLLIRPIELFQKDAETLAFYQRKWRYLLIDEYQDTNHAQYMLAKMLSAKHRNICVVGDDAQSIYAFRGADIKNILGFQRDFPNAEVVRLEQNYRSTKRILRLADSVIKQNQDQLDKTLWTDKQEGDYVTLSESLSERDEAQKIERTIRDIHLRHGLPYRSFAVLYRTNAQSRALEEALRRGGIPYQVVGGVTFYQRKEIKDALAYLRLIVNPSDNESLRRIINYPTRGIGNKTLERLGDFATAEGLTLWQAIERVEESGLSGRARGAIERFQFLIAKCAARIESAPADELARDLIQETGILTQLREENTVESLARWENVQELINGIAEFREQAEARGEAPTLGRFLQDVALLTDADKQTGDDNRVTLMTLHASKGLEFPVVFVTGLEEGLFPLAAAAQDRQELEEERRLFYVGVTRAQEKLFLSYARSRFRYGRHQDSIRSRFLEEVDESVVRLSSGAPHRARTGRFQDRGGTTAGYENVDPHYWRRESETRSRPAPRSTPQSTPSQEGRRIVYDEGAAEIAPGVQVEHPQFGPGKVISLKGQGDRARAVVFFRTVGQKTLILKYAGLQRVG